MRSTGNISKYFWIAAKDYLRLKVVLLFLLFIFIFLLILLMHLHPDLIFLKESLK